MLRFFYFLQGKSKKYLQIMNDYFDSPKYEAAFFNKIDVKLVRWIMPKKQKEVISLLQDSEFVDIDK